MKTTKSTTKKTGKMNKIGDDVLTLDSSSSTTFEKALKTVKSVKAKKEAEAVENAAQLKPGIILLEHIPFGFFEKELRGFFSQFGKVLRVRVARSEKTGKSKGYAYIEFEFEDVAKIAAESMDGYLMFERLMKCKVLPSDVNPYKVFSKSYIREKNYPKLKSREMVKKKQQIKHTAKQSRDILSARLNKLQEQNKKLAEIGIDYKYDAGHIELPEVEEKEDKPKVEKSPTPKKLKPNKKASSVSPLKKVSTPPAAAAPSESQETKTPKFPKFSPKLLRSRKSDISSLTVAALSSKKSAQKVETAAAAAAFSKKASISNSSPASKTPKAKAVTTPAPAESQETKTPKFSPKLLRSRKSDASALQKKTPEGQKNKSRTPAAGRKSVR